jgi:hypothetical protein
MASPSKNPFMRTYETMQAVVQMLETKFERYEAKRQEYCLVRRQLSPQERWEYMAVLNEHKKALKAWTAQLEKFDRRFLTLLAQVLADQFQQDVAGLDEELEQLWREHH